MVAVVPALLASRAAAHTTRLIRHPVDVLRSLEVDGVTVVAKGFRVIRNPRLRP
jgi:hypothetical protein